MQRSGESIGPLLRRHWRQLSGLPGGRWLFSRIVGRTAPYTGSIGAVVVALTPGHCEVVMRDRRRVRNHLGSVHAMALCNLGEMATGLALMNSLPHGARGILTGFSIEYLKKARGTLRAICDCAIPEDNCEQAIGVTATIHDSSSEVVAEAHARWLIGPASE